MSSSKSLGIAVTLAVLVAGTGAAWAQSPQQPTGTWAAEASGAYFYLVPSYYPETADPSLRVATGTYGVTFPAAVSRGSLFATQFHPEKSQRWGLRLLENFAAHVRARRGAT